MVMMSHAGDSAAKATWPRRDYRYRVIVATALPSHADDDDAESCWRQCCQGYFGHGAMSLPRQLGYVTMLLTSHADDVAAEPTWPWHDISTES
jgi:hypothetical protein